MEKNQKTVKVGTSALELLTIVFVVLKLLGYIDWSWWWVLAPTLIPLGIVILALVILVIVQSID